MSESPAFYSDRDGADASPFSIIVNAERTVRALYQRGTLKRFNLKRTARARSIATLPVRIAVKTGRVGFEGKRVLDYGKGLSVDSNFVSLIGGICYVYDFFHCPLSYTPQMHSKTVRIRTITPTDPSQLFDVVLCVYVLNVVTAPERGVVARALAQLVRPEGAILIGVREDTENIMESWEEYEDGYLTPAGTFQSFFKGNGLARLRSLFPAMGVERIGRGTYLIAPQPRVDLRHGKVLEAFL